MGMYTESEACTGRLAVKYSLGLDDVTPDRVEEGLDKAKREDVEAPVMEGVEEMLKRLTKYLREMKELGTDEKVMSVVRRRCVQVTSEIADLRDSLESAVKERLSPRQMELLGMDGEERVVDPSVQFFGMEWNKVFQMCFKIGINVRIFKQKLGHNPEEVDVIFLSTLLADLELIETEVSLHARAVLSGRLSTEQLSAQLEQQRRHRAIGQKQGAAARTGSFREVAQEGARRGRYRRNKTDNLVAALAVPIEMRAKTTELSLGGKRKQSLIDSVTTLFKGKK